MNDFYRTKEPFASLLGLCDELDYEYKTHDSHGFYISVFRPLRITIDPTPDSFYQRGECVKSYSKGSCLIRDGSHHYSHPTYLAEFDLSQPDGLDKMRSFLKNDVSQAKPIDLLESLFPGQLTFRKIVVGGSYRLSKKVLFFGNPNIRREDEFSVVLPKGLVVRAISKSEASESVTVVAATENSAKNIELRVGVRALEVIS